MHTIALPQAENDMHSATVVRWLVDQGHRVTAGQVVLEAQTERSRVEILADRDGMVSEILAPQGRTVAVGEPLARIGDADESPPAPPPQAQAEAQPQSPPADRPTNGPDGNVTPILMPQAGNTMEEGTIIAWRVKAGDKIGTGDIIFEVETDKAAVEVEAMEAGRLARIVVEEGETIEILKPVAYMADDDADVDAYLTGQGQVQSPAGGAQVSAPAEAPASAPTKVPAAPAAKTAAGRVKASPAARKLSAQRGIDLGTLGAGSGPGGRILSGDVPSSAPAPAATKAVGGEPVRRPMSPMRRAIARNLLASKQNIPHFYIELTIDAEPMMTFYRGEKAKYPCTINDVVVKACATAVAEFPAFRSRIDGDELVEFPTANIGIAVGVDDGLVVPVLIAADGMTLQQAAGQTRRIVEAARGGKVEGMRRGVLTVTNLGMFGIARFAGIINPPEAALLAVGAAREDVVVADGAIRAGRVMTMTLSCDHRVIDGLTAAKFLNRLKELLAEPQLLLDQ